ncbi:MAG: DUF1499 domain-containing protein [Gammaproteobacteria bacterium]|nr:DUF1499 domain-containing protein [Gammaproteobacteria bacterium]
MEIHLVVVKNLIHIRSALWVGYSDLEVNCK